MALLPDEHGQFGWASFTDLAQRTRTTDRPSEALNFGEEKASLVTVLPGDMTLLMAKLRVPEPIPPTTFVFNFQFDSKVMTPVSREAFRQAVMVIYRQVDANMKTRKAALVLVEGYTDVAGTQKFNDELSYERADAIALELKKAGISEDKIITRGHGSRNPISSPPGKIYVPINRRVEITVL